MFCMPKKKKLCPAYISKLNSNREKKVMLLMIPNEEKWHYLFADLECIIETIHGPKNNPGNSSTTKVSQHSPPAFSMSTRMMYLES